VGLLAAILETAHHSDSSDLSMCTVGKECSFSKIKIIGYILKIHQQVNVRAACGANFL
jgi:hypothetical protein